MAAADSGEAGAPPPVVPPALAPRSDVDRLAWLRLARSERVGPVTFLQLIRRYRGAAAALEALPEMTAGVPSGRRPRLCPLDRAEAEMAAAEARGARLLTLGGADYPALLAQLDAPPPVVWALGDPAVAGPAAVAVVGARNASAVGRRFAERLARDLSEGGAPVVSGLARGIDAAAHRGGLDGPSGSVAALAGGVDHIYPPEHADLHAEMAERGLLVSEMPMGFQPAARHFPRRNRVVSGLSLGVVVVEAAERSGSLITARFAGEQGREAMAAPGHPFDARASGCNALIREGATLIRGAEDVLEAVASAAPRLNPLGPLFVDEDDAPAPAADPDGLRARLETLLSVTATPIDELIRRSGGEAGAVAWALLELELSGLIERRPGGLVARLPVDRAAARI